MKDTQIKLEKILGLYPIWPNLTKKSCKLEYTERKRSRYLYNLVGSMIHGYETADIDTMNRWAELYGVPTEEGDTPCMVREKLRMSVKESSL